MENDKMEVIVLMNNDIKIKKIPNVKIIRINDQYYNLLIAKDYWPVIGEINGSISIEADEAIIYENVNAYYMLSNNVFRLIIRKMEE